MTCTAWPTKSKCKKIIIISILDNQDLTLRLSTVTPAGSPAGRLWTQYCRGAEHAQRPEADPYIANGVAEDEVRSSTRSPLTPELTPR